MPAAYKQKTPCEQKDEIPWILDACRHFFVPSEKLCVQVQRLTVQLLRIAAHSRFQCWQGLIFGKSHMKTSSYILSLAFMAIQLPIHSMFFSHAKVRKELDYSNYFRSVLHVPI